MQRRYPAHVPRKNGVEIDYCPECRGIWLDRGELDKIVERARGAQREYAVYDERRDDRDRRDSQRPIATITITRARITRRRRKTARCPPWVTSWRSSVGERRLTVCPTQRKKAGRLPHNRAEAGRFVCGQAGMAATAYYVMRTPSPMGHATATEHVPSRDTRSASAVGNQRVASARRPPFAKTSTAESSTSTRRSCRGLKRGVAEGSTGADALDIQEAQRECTARRRQSRAHRSRVRKNGAVDTVDLYIGAGAQASARGARAGQLDLLAAQGLELGGRLLRDASVLQARKYARDGQAVAPGKIVRCAHIRRFGACPSRR